jgi:PAS domain S-box-containing protein
MSAAKSIIKNKETILELWEETVRSYLESANELSSIALKDSLPEFLESLATFLQLGHLQKGVEEAERCFAKEHAQERYQFSRYSLSEIIEEYNILRRVILRVLREEVALSHDEVDLILETIHIGIRDASLEFIRIRDEEKEIVDRQLREVYTNQRIIFEGVKDYAFIRTDLEGKIIDWNNGAENIIGWKAQEAIGQSGSLIFTEEDRENKLYQEEIRQAIKDNKAEDNRWHVKKDGSLFFAMGIMNPLKRDDGEIFGFIKVLQDQTERKKMEVKLQQQKEELEVFFNLSGVGKIIIDIQSYKLLRANPIFLKLLGRESENLSSLSLSEIIHPDDFFKMQEIIIKSKQKSIRTSTEVRLLCRDKSMIWGEIHTMTLPGNELFPFQMICTLIDISERKRSEEVLKGTLENLELERHLRENFVATLTHDLRTPLTAAKMSAHLLIKRLNDPEAVQKIAGRISYNIDRADLMIRDLLDANRISAGASLPLEMEECNLSEIARDTLEELASIHGDRFELKSKESILGMWSKSALRRMIENLCNNAVKYGSLEGVITVYLDKRQDKATMSVHNSGNPIPPEQQKLLFQQYRRLDSVQSKENKGWGLGLTLVKGFAEAHGGSVEVESSEATGTTFQVLLPLDGRSSKAD